MTDIVDQKAAMRQAAYGLRKTAHGDYAGSEATDTLLGFLKPHLGQTISAYMPIRTEVDILPAMAVLAGSGPVAVPIVLGRGQALEFHRWRPDMAMQDGPFGARVPVDGEPVVPQVVILPLLAFDARGYRLGYGGGFYDRSLETLRANGPVLAVGFAYGAQQVDTVPIEPTDQRMDAMVTERGVLVFDKND